MTDSVGRCAGAILLALGCLVSMPGIATAAPRVFVMPLEVESPTKRTYWVGEGAAILVADELLALGADAISREQRVSAFEQLRLPRQRHADPRHDDSRGRGVGRDRRGARQR